MRPLGGRSRLGLPAAGGWLGAAILLVIGSVIIVRSEPRCRAPALGASSDANAARASGISTMADSPSRRVEEREATNWNPVDSEVVDRYWVYEVEEHGCCNRSFRQLALSGTPTEILDLLACLDDAALPDDVHVVLEVETVRSTMVRADLNRGADWLCAVVRERARLASRSVRFVVTDRATSRPIPGILLDRLGRPLGPVGGEPTAVRLPETFAGAVSAVGYAPVEVSLPGHVSPGFFVAMRTAACIRGRLAPAVSDVFARLFAIDVEPSPGECVHYSGRISADGAFHIGPLPSGSYSLSLESETAWLTPPARILRVAAGRQDIGEVKVEMFSALHLEVTRSDGRGPGRVFVRAWFDGVEPRADVPGVVLPVAEDGGVVLEKVRPVRLAIEAWTTDGWSAAIGGVLASDHPAERALRVDLEPPGTLDVRVDLGPFAVPLGCRILLQRPAGPAVNSRHSVLGHVDRVEYRARDVALPEDGRASIERLWSGLRTVSVVSPHGSVLAREDIVIRSGETTYVDLATRQLVGALSAVAQLGSGRRRFACLSDADGMAARFVLESDEPTLVLLPVGRYRVRVLAGSVEVGAPGDLDAHEVDITAGRVTAATL